MEMKPIKLQPIKPVAVKPIQMVAPATKPVVSEETNADEIFNEIFGEGNSENTESAVAQTNETSETNEVKETAKKAARKAVDKLAGQKEESEDTDKKEDKKKEKKSKAKKYTGPREVKVYGMTLWTEENPDVTLEQIRQRIVDEFHYPEFSASRTTMSFDEETGIVVPLIKFEKKG